MRTALGIMVQVQVRTVYPKPIHMLRFISNRETSEIYFAVVVSLSLPVLNACTTRYLNTYVLTWPLAIIVSLEMSMKSPRAY